jgi:hypothetical protein
VFRRNLDADLPQFRFRVHYHVNNADIVFEHGLSFVEDTTAYEFGTAVTILPWDYEMYSTDYSFAYEFVGWVRAPHQVTEDIIQPGDVHTLHQDLHLYALWTRHNLMYINAQGTASIDPKYKNLLVDLMVPNYINNIKVRRLDTSFASGDSSALFQSVHFPKYVEEVLGNTFTGFLGSTITFYENLSGMPDIAFRTNAFAGLLSVTQIIIPLHVKVIEENAFPARGTGTKTTIYCRVLESNKPIGWHENWYNNTEEDYEIVWGYNG